ncbi:MAG: acyl-CoA dehydrogenase [Acidobacteria bacterium]|nr:MAG: acyl-CoA dehydrogenase [Acidobacteriota bacterium]
MKEQKATQGGEFLLTEPAAIFSPESFSEQQRLIAETAERFAQEEIAPAGEKIEQKDFATVRGLLRRAGELGLTGVEVPEDYGGLGLDFTASAIVADHLAIQGSFSVAFGAHAGIATLPLVFFGNDEQKRCYLPRLASSEWVGAYALSEAGSGSDALAMRTQAEREGGGGFRLNGEKMWISNAGFADLFTVFAKVDGKATAFLVEAATAGVSTGAEEHKMGIHGSSTRPLLLRDARIAEANVLGGVGEGAHIAFQILNVGRFKLGAACIGGGRNCLREAIQYARERQAFGKSIAEFGLIREHIARMATGLFAAESAVYRTVGLMDHIHRLDEFAMECSMVKVHASEILDDLVDRAVQIHGGNGFVHGNLAEAAYRDARVNRIFEGTNEINRMLLTGMALRRAQKGELPLREAVEGVIAEVMGPAQTHSPAEQARRATLLVAGLAVRRFGEAIEHEQVVLAALADLMIAVYVLQAVAARQPDALMTQVLASRLLDEVDVRARYALATISSGDELRTQAAWVRRLLKRDLANVAAWEQQIAARVIEAGRYLVV